MNQKTQAQAHSTIRQLGAFLIRPQLTQPSGLRAKGALAAWGVLTALHIAVLLVVLMPFLHLWQQTFDLPSPDAFDALPDGWLIPVSVLAAPVIEEMLFRGWLTGRWRALWLLACTLGLVAAIAFGMTGLAPEQLGLLLLALLVAGLVGWIVLRKRGAPGWFGAAFPAIFYLSALVFGLVHITNYPQVSLLALPLVLPQTWSGLLLGYMRMRIGLVASMLTHGTANAVALSLALMAG